MISSNYTIYIGPDGIKEVYEQILQQNKLDVICLSDQYMKVIRDYFETSVMPQLYTKGKTVRELLPATPGNLQEQVPQVGKSERRFLPLPAKGQSDLVIGENSVGVISFNLDSPSALIITDPELVTTFQTYFEHLWVNAKQS